VASATRALRAHAPRDRDRLPRLWRKRAARGAATRDDFARAALAALDALGIGRAHICGLSLGGVVAIAMHALAPERCASLILADTFAVHPDGQAIYDRSVAASQTMTMRELAEARAPSLLGAAASEAVKAEVIATMGRIDPAAYRQGAQAVWLADQQDRAARSPCRRSSWSARRTASRRRRCRARWPASPAARLQNVLQ
jgi:pimeloyl-ACP methyl ester carboxylesterase